MCEVQKRELITNPIVSCQLSFYPLGEVDFLPFIDTVIAIIQNSGLPYTVNDMSTIISGESAQVFTLLQTITNTMHAQQCSFSMNITFSNTCGVDCPANS